MSDKNYTLGKGKLFFKKAGSSAYEFMGNCPEFSLNISAESLDHFQSTAGIKTKDASATLQINRSGTITTDNISAENLALYFGTLEQVTQVATPVIGYAMNDVVKGGFYQIGATPSNPAGVKPVTAVTVKKGSTSLVAGTDYIVDLATGLIEILTTSVTILANDDLTVDYTPTARTYSRITTTSTGTVEGAIMYVATNPKGKLVDVYMNSVTIRPAGDFSLIGDDWQSMQYTVEIGEGGISPAIVCVER